MLHFPVCGSHHAKFDDDDFHSFRGVACEGQTHRYTETHTETASSMLTFSIKQKGEHFSRQKRWYAAQVISSSYIQLALGDVTRYLGDGDGGGRGRGVGGEGGRYTLPW